MNKPKLIRIGLISDTHMPERCREFPASLYDLFDGVDMILHAGDVGELNVLDELSQLAPVVAVHGNDDTPEAQRELPYQQILTIGGQRILLWHSHFEDRVDEMAARRDDHWDEKFHRLSERARRAGAEIVVYGHFHVPMVERHNGTLLINPGALASGNPFVRQARRSVAIMSIGDGPVAVTHYDLDKATQFAPHYDLAEGIKTIVRRTNPSIVDAELGQKLKSVNLYRYFHGEIKRSILDLAHQCWSENRTMTIPMLAEAISCNEFIRPEDKAFLLNQIE